ncbi:MAG: CPBP family intramembrane metalloprotease [Flavobacteriaceae bacterium]|nr:CPBP family intramembrane metalloprotease [Flavobacteriaceae bacterium]
MYIEQAFKSDYAIWKYLIVPGLFLGLIVLNGIAIYALDLDVEELMRVSIEQMGELLFFAQNLILFVVFLAILFVWTKLVHKQSITSLTTSRKKISWKRIFFAFGLWGGLTIVITFLDYYMNPDSYVWNFDLPKFAGLAIISILMVPIQTSFEEYLFRGHMMQGIGSVVKNRWVPLLVTSVIFGLMHISNPEVGKIGPIIMIYYIGTGLFLGIMTLMDEGLELALGFHAANNLITALLVTADWTAFQTPSLLRDVSAPATGFDIIIPVFVVFPIILFIFAKVYKWNNWKEKLTGKVIVPEDNTSDKEIDQFFAQE